jgi:hypothetical protein
LVHSGRIAAYVFGPLVLSGYLIQSLTSPLTLEVLAWAHLVLGIVGAGAIGVHRGTLHGRRKQRTGALPVLQLPNQLGSTESEEIANEHKTNAATAAQAIPDQRGAFSTAHALHP